VIVDCLVFLRLQWSGCGGGEDEEDNGDNGQTMVVTIKLTMKSTNDLINNRQHRMALGLLAEDED
jgi:hypothetical protein